MSTTAQQPNSAKSTASDLPYRRILVLGSGNFGSCLADHLAVSESEHYDIEVFIWSRDAETVKSLNEKHRNPKYLKDHVFPENLKAIGPGIPDKEFLDSVDVLLFAIPTPGLRKFLTDWNTVIDIARSDRLYVFVNKGIEMGTKALTLEIIADTLGKEIAKVATFISGPSFASEIVQRLSTHVSVCSLSEEHALRVSKIFHQPFFRCYPGTDPIGVELAGALKNVYAIAAGVADGLGYQNNTRAGLVTRALAEMTKIGQAYGADPLTFLTLAGVGDLFLTCSSPNSRNYTVGYRLGKGQSLEEIIRTLGSVSEGVTTTKALYELLKEMDIQAPVAEMMYRVLYEGMTPLDSTNYLLNFPPARRELDLQPHGPAEATLLLRKLGIEK